MTAVAAAGNDPPVPPHDLDAEAAVLAAIMLDRDALDAVADRLRPEHFYAEAHRRVFEAARSLAESGRPTDVVTIAGWLRDHDRLAQVGGAAYLGQLVDAVPSVAHIETYAERVREKSRMRDAIRVCMAYGRSGFEHAGDAQEFLDQLEGAVYEIARESASDDGQPIGFAARSVFGEVADAAQRGEMITGTPTGFDRLDALTAGLHGDELTVVAARPGMGKTSLALDVALHVADKQARSVVIFSLEMPRKQLAARAICSTGNIDVGKLRQHSRLTREDWENLTNATAFLHKLPIEIHDAPDENVLSIRGKARRAIAKFERNGQPPLGLVVIDYLQLMRGTGGERSREEEVARISRGLKALSKELHVPVVALAQLNREVEKRGKDKRPQLSDLRESGAIEQDADNVLFVHREDYYDRESDAKGIAEIIVAKQRNGPTGKALVKWLAHCTSFRNLAPHEYPKEEA